MEFPRGLDNKDPLARGELLYLPHVARYEPSHRSTTPAEYLPLTKPDFKESRDQTWRVRLPFARNRAGLDCTSNQRNQPFRLACTTHKYGGAFGVSRPLIIQSKQPKSADATSTVQSASSRLKPTPTPPVAQDVLLRMQRAFPLPNRRRMDQASSAHAALQLPLNLPHMDGLDGFPLPLPGITTGMPQEAYGTTLARASGCSRIKTETCQGSHEDRPESDSGGGASSHNSSVPSEVSACVNHGTTSASAAAGPSGSSGISYPVSGSTWTSAWPSAASASCVGCCAAWAAPHPTQAHHHSLFFTPHPSLSAFQGFDTGTAQCSQQAANAITPTGAKASRQDFDTNMEADDSADEAALDEFTAVDCNEPLPRPKLDMRPNGIFRPPQTAAPWNGPSLASGLDGPAHPWPEDIIDDGTSGQPNGGRPGEEGDSSSQGQPESDIPPRPARRRSAQSRRRDAGLDTYGGPPALRRGSDP